MRGAFERQEPAPRCRRAHRDRGAGRHEAGQTAYRVDRDRYELRDLDSPMPSGGPAGRGRCADHRGRVRHVQARWSRRQLASITANLPQLEVLPALREAIARRATVAFRYHDARGRCSPTPLLLREGFWYVMGHDEGRRSARIASIASRLVVQGDGDRVRRPGFDPRRLSRRSEGAGRRTGWRSFASTRRGRRSPA